jgi:flagellar basal body-associated protein FliL
MDKSKMMMIIIIALLVLLLGTVVGVGVYLINITPPERNPELVQPRVEGVTTPANMRIVSLDDMIANLYPGPNGRQDTVSVEIIVGIDESEYVDKAELEEFYDIFTRRIPLARSVALNVFVSRTFEELNTLEGRRETAEIIKNELRQAFDSPLIVGVSFSNIVVLRGV